jgi:hypothetical protein
MNGHNGTNGSSHESFATAHLTWADPERQELEGEQNRLRLELAAAKATLQAAKDRITNRDEALHQALREELAVAQQAMADREEAHRLALTAIRDDAQRDAARIVDQATNGPLDEAPVTTPQVDHGQ